MQSDIKEGVTTLKVRTSPLGISIADTDTLKIALGGIGLVLQVVTPVYDSFTQSALTGMGIVPAFIMEAWAMQPTKLTPTITTRIL